LDDVPTDNAELLANGEWRPCEEEEDEVDTKDVSMLGDDDVVLLQPRRQKEGCRKVVEGKKRKFPAGGADNDDDGIHYLVFKP
jgi:hypothetical protein